MIKHVYCFYSETANFFAKPDINGNAPAQALEEFKRSLALDAKTFATNGIHTTSLYYLGTFDDATGVFDSSQKVKLIDAKEIEALLASALGSLEVVPNGNPENGTRTGN